MLIPGLVAQQGEVIRHDYAKYSTLKMGIYQLTLIQIQQSIPRVNTIETYFDIRISENFKT